MSLPAFSGGPNGWGNGLRKGLTVFQQYREGEERKAEPHLGSRKNKTTNQVSLNLKFFPS